MVAAVGVFVSCDCYNTAAQERAFLRTPPTTTVGDNVISEDEWQDVSNLRNEPLASVIPHPLYLTSGVFQPMLKYEKSQQVDLQQVIHLTLLHAPEIRVLKADVGISVAEVQLQQAAFDWSVFLDTAWDDRNTPVASALDGAQNRLRTAGLSNSAGIRQGNLLGGSTRIAQDANFQDSNSQFFSPRDQAIARLGLTYEQPLLRGGGRVVATSRFEIAVADAEATREEMIAGIQALMLRTINTFWELSARRARYLVQLQNYKRAQEVFNLVANRGNMDVGPGQAARSEATLASRKTETLRAEYAVVLSQEQLSRLIYGPEFINHTDLEWIPTTELLTQVGPVEPTVQMQIALRYRPEVRRTIQEIKQLAIQQQVAKNQLLPALGLAISASNQGLQGDRRFFSAADDQFNLGNASYGMGLSYEMPIGNRAAKANLHQANLRVARLQSQFETVLADIGLEVRNAAYNLTLSDQETELSAQEMMFAKRELEVIETRYKLLVDGADVGTLYLDNLLQTQERLAAAEIRFVDAAVRCRQAEFELQRANGLLLRESDGAQPPVGMIVDEDF